jgi:hypothetical protein
MYEYVIVFISYECSCYFFWNSVNCSSLKSSIQPDKVEDEPLPMHLIVLDVINVKSQCERNTAYGAACYSHVIESFVHW